MPSLSVSGPAAAEVPNRHRLGSDVVHHPVAADTQPPSVKRPVGERPGRAGLISEPGDRVEHLADPIGVVAEEPGGLVDRLGLSDDLAVHPARPEPPQRLVVRYVRGLPGSLPDTPVRQRYLVFGVL
jgi:hypothetical protein